MGMPGMMGMARKDSIALLSKTGICGNSPLATGQQSHYIEWKIYIERSIPSRLICDVLIAQ
jgi:hypothetical protein